MIHWLLDIFLKELFRNKGIRAIDPIFCVDLQTKIIIEDMIQITEFRS